MKIIISAFLTCLFFCSSVSYAVSPVVTDKPSTTAASVKTVASQEYININTADAESLTRLKGVGPKKAEAIIAWRKANGVFKTIEQFMDVKGIGSATLEANRKNIRL